MSAASRPLAQDAGTSIGPGQVSRIFLDLTLEPSVPILLSLAHRFDITLATRDGDKLSVLVWHYHDDDLVGPDARVRVDLTHLPKAFVHGARLVHYRIDRDHSNSYAAWLAMGSPIAPSEAQRKTLIEASRLSPLDPEPSSIPVTHGAARLDFTLPRQGVSLLRLTW